MLKRFFPAILFSVVLIGKIHAQEVIVAREKKSDLRRHTPQPSEQLPSESTTPTPRKSEPREKKSAPTMTLEEMRAAGARAAEGSNDRVSQSAKVREPDVESAPLPNATVAETRKPVKRETPVEQRSSSHRAKSRGANIEGIGPIRPTIMETGREAASPSPPVR